MNISTVEALKQRPDLLKEYLFHLVREHSGYSAWKQELCVNFCEDALLENGFFEGTGVLQTLDDLNAFCRNLIAQWKNNKSSDVMDNDGLRQKTVLENTDGEEFSWEEVFVSSQPEDQFPCVSEEDPNAALLQKRIQQLSAAFDALSQRDKSRFWAAYLARRNWTQHASLKSPSELSPRLRDLLQAYSRKKENVHGARISPLEKYNLLWNFQGEGLLWDLLQTIFVNEVAYKDRFSEQARYALYLKQAQFTRNITRDKEAMTQNLMIFLQRQGIIEKSLLENFKQSIGHISIPPALLPVPRIYYTERDQCLITEQESFGCGRFSDLLVQYAQSCAKGQSKAFAQREEVGLFLMHLRQCAVCREGAQKLIRSLTYRQQRQAGKWPSGKIYPAHVASEAASEKTKREDSVREYKRLYRKNPCLLNTYYLLLSYLQAGEYEAAKKMWQEVKNLSQNVRLRQSFLSSVLEGEKL